MAVRQAREVRVLVPYVDGGLKPETLAAVRNSGLPFEAIVLEDDSAYHELIARAWAEAKTFIVVEQDIVPHPGALAELLLCPEPWCAFGYEYPPFGLYAGMGCAKFATELLVVLPTAMEETAGWSDATHPAKHWCRVDGWLKQWLIEHGARQHVHGQVTHLHKGRPAHDCTTPEQARQIRLENERRQAGGGQDSMSSGRPPTFSFLIPTHREDRPLWRCLDSLLPQLDRDDEVIVIGDTHDGPLPKVEKLVRGYDAMAPVGHFRYLELDAGAHDWGHSQLNYGLERATGQWLHCNDDDDIYAPGAVAIMREAARTSGGRPLLFRFQSYHFGGQVYWFERGRLERNYVGGHCLVTPNVAGKVGRWTPSYQGDFDYIAATIVLHVGWVDPNYPIWREEIIAIARPSAVVSMVPAWT